MEKKNLILVDGHALAFRSFHAFERTRMQTSKNEPTWAVFGFFKAIFDLLKNKNIKIEGLAVAFDVSHQTFRVQKYEQYKANRTSMPDELRSQIKLIVEGLEAFNIPIFTKEGFEADDIIGSIVEKNKNSDVNILILTGDKDSFQLIDPKGAVKVLIFQPGGIIEYGWESVFKKVGVYPDQIIDFKALSGDTSDNIPGIKGIGPKTASDLLQKYQDIENIYNNIDSISQKSLKTKLLEGKESAFLSRFLATIDRNVDINFDLNCTRMQIANPKKPIEFFKRLQFYGFVKNIDEIFSYFNSNTTVFEKKEKYLQTQLCLDFHQNRVESVEFLDQIFYEDFQKTIVENQKQCEEMFAKLEKQSLVSFWFAPSKADDAFNSEIVCFSCGFDSSLMFENSKILKGKKDSHIETFFVNFSNLNCTKIERKMILDQLKSVLENKNIKKSIFDAKFAINLLTRNSINLEGVVFDPVLASYVNNPSRRHDLNIQSQENLDFLIKSKDEFLGKGKNALTFENAPCKSLQDFCLNNTIATLKLTNFWTENFDEANFKILNDIELPLTFVLAKMEQNGVKIDTSYLSTLNEAMCHEIGKLENEIFELAGESFNVNSPKKVGEILFDKLNLKTKSRQTSKHSTNAKVLEELAINYPIAQKIMDHRHLMKLKNTYIDALPLLIDRFDGRIHTTFNQTIAATGRLTSTNPNLQNIPIRTNLGAKIRKAFISDKPLYEKLLCADYSQIELRLLAHLSGDENLIEAFKHNQDVHASTASKIYGVSIANVTKEMRRQAKAVNFGIVYGQTKFGLSQALGISQKEAQSFIDKYFQTYPKVKEYMDESIKKAKEKGYCETMFSRKRFLSNELSSSNRQIQEFAQRAAINSPLQGSASDLIKIAMIDLDKKLQKSNLKSKLILQVHDELVVEVYKDELEIVKKLVEEAMLLNQPLKVPLVVDIDIGESWMKE